MIDMEKVIAWLADEELYYREHGDTHNSLMACDAIELLKEQEAKTVESIKISRNIYAELTGYCPSCNRPLKERFNKRFCGECGQAVKWA